MSSIVVFTRDLRVRDNPALDAAVAEDPEVVPLFVLDPAVLEGRHGSANRRGFLAESLADLDRSLQRIGGRLVVRRGDWVDEVLRTAHEAGATSVHLADDVSSYAKRRMARLEAAVAPAGVAVVRHPGVTVVPAGGVSPAGGGEFKVFTPYFRRWLDHRWRAPAPSPQKISTPNHIAGLPVPPVGDLAAGPRSPHVAPGGETAGLAALRAFTADALAIYDDRRDDLAADATARISAHLHFGCVSPLEVARRLRDRPGGAAFVRQLCWRDFFHQLLAARPHTAHTDYRPSAVPWRHDAELFEAWQAGRTGYPAVDAAMRQLNQEGFIHNRARMITASFLTKDLRIDWRLGAAHFMSLLVDGDVACNQLNWQWVAGTGVDTNPHRIFNPTLQGRRFDPTGAYVHRYVEELRAVPAADVHEPPERLRNATGYPLAVVDHREAIAEYRSLRQGFIRP